MLTSLAASYTKTLSFSNAKQVQKTPSRVLPDDSRIVGCGSSHEIIRCAHMCVAMSSPTLRNSLERCINEGAIEQVGQKWRRLISVPIVEDENNMVT